MNLKAVRLNLVFLAVLQSTSVPQSSRASSPAQEVEPASIVSIGEDHATHRSTTRSLDIEGRVVESASEVTIIGNAIHYLENGEWKSSESLIELRPDTGGAVAVRGPHKAAFAPSLGDNAAFSIQMSDGRQLSGAVRVIRLSDGGGQVVTVATVRDGVAGRLIPPNAILFENAFEGLAVDLVLVWRHDRFSHDIALRETPKLPAGWDPSKTRIEVLTDFWADGAVDVRRQKIEDEAGETGINDTQVVFGRMSLEVGEAYPIEGVDAWMLGGGFARDGAIPVRKRWEPLAPGNYLLIESIPYSAVADTLAQRQASGRRATAIQETYAGRSANPPLLGDVGLLSAQSMKPTALRMSSLGRRPLPTGYLVDFTIVPANQITNFVAGETYYIQSNYTISATATFGTNAVLKFKNGTYLRVSGVVNFPPSGPQVVFTSRDDDLFGTKVTTNLVTNESSNSDGNPTDHRATFALHLYYNSVGNTVRNARFRWAQTAIKYDNSIGNVNGVDNCVFEHTDYGISAVYIPSSHYVNVSGCRHCNVTTPASGYVNGTIATDAGVVNASIWTNYQAEPAIAVRQITSGDFHNTKVVIVALSRTQLGDDTGMLRMISSDGGSTWPTVGYIATGGSNDIPRADGDADPSLAYDQYNNLFLAYRRPGGGGAVLATSANDGTNWTQVTGFNGTNFGGSTPRVAVGPTNGSGVASLWVSLQTNGARAPLSCIGTSIRGPGSTNVGGTTNWTSAAHLPGVSRAVFHSVAVGPTGQVAVVYTKGPNDPYELGPMGYYTVTDSDGLGPNGFAAQASATFTNLYGETLLPAHHQEVSPIPVLAWHWYSNLLYMVYTGRTNITDNADADVMVRTSTNSGATWSNETKTHSHSSKSQFHPWLALDQKSGNAAVIWYDARDNSTNSQAHIYGVVSRNRFDTNTAHQIFRITPTPANPSAADFTLKEYIGFTYFGGSLYPAWINHRATNDLAWDIYSARVPF